MTEHPVDITEVARGNLIVQRITEEKGEGIIITWAEPHFKPTYINSFGYELPLYDYVKKQILILRRLWVKDSLYLYLVMVK